MCILAKILVKNPWRLFEQDINMNLLKNTHLGNILNVQERLFSVQDLLLILWGATNDVFVQQPTTYLHLKNQQNEAGQPNI